MSKRSWKEVSQRHLRRVPNGSPFSAFQAALREASREYRGLTSGGTGRSRPRRSNPSTNQLLKIGLLVGGGYLAYKHFVKKAG